MAGKITDAAALTALADDDLIEVVDVSDTSMAATGTNKKASVDTLRRAGRTLSPLIMGVGQGGNATTWAATTSTTGGSVSPDGNGEMLLISVEMPACSYDAIGFRVNGFGGADGTVSLGRYTRSGTTFTLTETLAAGVTTASTSDKIVTVSGSLPGGWITLGLLTLGTGAIPSYMAGTPVSGAPHLPASESSMQAMGASAYCRRVIALSALPSSFATSGTNTSGKASVPVIGFRVSGV